MSVTDRMHRRQAAQKAQTAEGLPGTGLSSIPAARPQVIQRLEYVVNSLHAVVEANDDSGTMARFSFIARAMIEEITSELEDRDEATLQAFMSQIGDVIGWIGHGDAERVPANLQEFVGMRPEIEQAAS